jgi:glycosyltransferase involved in cell wall biosynthesis
MKILHVASFLQGGAGRVIVELAAAEQRAGHEVTVVTSSGGAPGYGNYDAYLDMLTAAGVAWVRVDSLFHRRPEQIIHAHAAVPGLAALVFMGARRVPAGLVETMHGWGQAKTPEQSRSDVAVLNLMDRVVVPSRSSADLIGSLGVERSRLLVVPYGVPASAPELSEADHDTWMTMTRARRAGWVVIACVGTIGPRKNQRLLVEAVAALRHHALCVLIGDGDTAAIRSAVVEHGCERRVCLHGYSKSARTLAAHADLLVLPSRSEGQPLAILEAFADGLLVATSDVPELVELVSDGVTGFTFAAEDAASLASTITHVATLSNSSRRTVREAARRRYAAEFTSTGMIDRYAAVYRGVIGRTASGHERLTPPAA